jgi:hypothetical protein
VRIRSLALTLLFAATALPARAYDRLGSDIGPATPVANADQCNAMCNGNAACQSWVLVAAGNTRFANATPLCFLKNAVPVPSFNTTCPNNTACVSGVKNSNMWCGDDPGRNATGTPANSNVMGQGSVLTCPAPLTCGPKLSNSTKTTVCWFLFIPYPCHENIKIQTTDFFCQ